MIFAKIMFKCSLIMNFASFEKYLLLNDDQQTALREIKKKLSGEDVNMQLRFS